MQAIPLQCQCGAVKGHVTQISKRTNRVICYCDDCQKFAHTLDADPITLDTQGGTDILQVTPAQIQITQGSDNLRALKLDEKGLLRWYSSCCQTPIANTVSGKIPFVGLIHTFIDCSPEQLNSILPVKYRIFGQYAQGKISSDVNPGAPIQLVATNIRNVLMAKIQGLGHPSPFFSRDGTPISNPKVFN